MRDAGMGHAHLPPESARYREHVERLIRRLGEAEGSLQELAAGELDAVLDPGTATPILLSRAQEAIARSEARYRDLVSRAPLIVCELAPSGETLFVNEAVRTVLGHEPARLQGELWWSALAPDVGAGDAEEMRKTMEAANVTAFELPVATADGRVKWIAWNSANRYGSDGALESVVLFGVDVSARREAEESARKLESERVARAEAEAANRAKSEFLAMMSHELRTPLNAIAGYADLLLLGIRGPLTPEQTADLERIRRSQKHLLTLIDDVLSFARLEVGRLELHFSTVSILDVMRSTHSVTAPLLQSKKLAFHMVECSPSLTVWADRERTEQVLINLVTNAIKYTPEEGAVSIECEEHTDHVAIRVRDTGHGIPEGKMELIFEPFMQLADSAAGRQDGVGLGLAISRDLARAMHGEITVESVESQGSTFTFILPLPPDASGRNDHPGRDG
jgi:PAS domain S-box-containing protein